MADEETKVVETKLYSRKLENRTLEQSISWFSENAGHGYGLLYTPASCFLATVDQNGELIGSSGKEDKPVALTKADFDTVFEARLFNSKAELRWLRAGEKGIEVVLSETQGEGQSAIDEIYAKIQPANSSNKSWTNGYLLWGQSTGVSVGDWTQFGEARVGAFFVPLQNVPPQEYARFTATEYLGEYKDGNVSVVEERLTGIEPNKNAKV